jgi:hypothetical protein
VVRTAVKGSPLAVIVGIGLETELGGDDHVFAAVSKNVTPRSTAARMSLIASDFSVAGPNPKLKPMHPRPSADTSRPLSPNVRVCITFLPVVQSRWSRTHKE